MCLYKTIRISYKEIDTTSIILFIKNTLKGICSYLDMAHLIISRSLHIKRCAIYFKFNVKELCIHDN